jgi:hypothetical protein
MPAAYGPDTPLQKNRRTDGWIGPEPREYFVRAKWAENALDLAVFCDYVLGGEIPERYAGRVALSRDELSSKRDRRVFSVLVGNKPGPKPGEMSLATEVTLIEGTG